MRNIRVNIKLVRVFLFLLVCATPALTMAQNVSVRIDPGQDSEALARSLGSSIDDLEQILSDEIRRALSLEQPQQYLEDLADAQAFSTKGLMVDYASDFDGLLLGFGANVSFAVSDDLTAENTDRPIDGVAPNLSGLVGFDLGSGLRVFVSGFAQNRSFDEFDVKLRNFGVHGQLKLFGGDGDSTSEYVWDWRGFDITAGVTRATTTLTLEDQDLTTALPVDLGGTDVPVDMTSAGTFIVETSAFTIPLELTTSVTLLSVATVYGGIGTDIQAGDASAQISLEGELVGDNPEGGAPLDLGRATIAADERADASPGRLRALAGLQLNLWALKVFGQLNYLPGIAASGALGVKLAF